MKGIRQEEQDAQQKHIDQGHGGGIASSRALAEQGEYRVFSGKFLISPGDFAAFEEICSYWEGKCFMDQGDRLWRNHYPEAEFIEKGWAIGLYTAPHGPCPEGRLILDYETAFAKGYDAILAEIDERLATFRPSGTGIFTRT